MRQQCGADASGPPSSCEPGSPRSEALVLELPSLSRGQAQREKSLRSARVALAQLRLVATPPDDPRRVRAKIVNSISWGLRRSQTVARLISRIPHQEKISGNIPIRSARELLQRTRTLTSASTAPCIATSRTHP